jgi:hypothetical protein
MRSVTRVAFLAFLALFVAPLVTDAFSANWSSIVRQSKTLATLQVVVNPLFNNATTPVAGQAWSSLASLNAERVRFAAWFPYPQWSVAELFPPNVENQTTSWNFTGLMTQLTPFLSSVRSSVLDISTSPKWLRASNSNPPTFSTDPRSNRVDWGYYAPPWLANTSWEAASYFSRVAEWLITGITEDEFGNPIYGGPALGPEKLGTWEILNEPEYEMGVNSPSDYISVFDATVLAVRARADPERKLEFQGMALEGHGEWDWWNEFLNPANHDPLARDALNWASFHFYSTPAHRVDNSTWEWELFDPVDDFAIEAYNVTQIRDRLSPGTKLNADECGTILPSDNDPSSPWPANLYFAGAGAHFAYTYAKLSEVGIDVVGESQLAGVPVLPEWDIHEAQYPSVSLLNWTNGHGNPRFYVLQEILRHFAVGDEIVSVQQYAAREVGCAARWNRDQLGLGYARTMSLECEDPDANITSIVDAAAGDFLGSCDTATDRFRLRNGSTCVDPNQEVLAVVSLRCLGYHSCTLDLSEFANIMPCGTYRLWAQAKCSSGLVRAEPSGYKADRVWAHARWTTVSSPHGAFDSVDLPSGAAKEAATSATTITKEKRLLIINKNNDVVNFQYDALATASSIRVVDQYSYFSAQSVPIPPTGTLQLPPFGTAFVKWD